MANISTVMELIKLCRKAKISPFVWGTHGLGKSSSVHQVADELGISIVDFRLAQIESSDLRGLPDKGSDGCTHYLPPVELPTDGEGILFLDELNRAAPEVLSAAFQLVLDRRIGSYRLPDGWSIVCAGNFDHADYEVTSLDAAFRSRFCHIVLSSGKSTFGDWSEWITRKYPTLALNIVSFCGDNLKHLEDGENDGLGFRIMPSRRSWEMAIRCLQAWNPEEFSTQTRLEALAGLVGRDLAIAYLNHETSISPQDLLKSGVKKLKSTIKALSRSEKMALLWGLASHVENSMDDAQVAEVVMDFVEFLLDAEKDLAIAFCTECMRTTTKAFAGMNEARRTVLLRNPRLNAAVARVNQRQSGKTSFVERLAKREKLAHRIAEAAAIQSPAESELLL